MKYKYLIYLLSFLPVVSFTIFEVHGDVLYRNTAYIIIMIVTVRTQKQVAGLCPRMSSNASKCV